MKNKQPNQKQEQTMNVFKSFPSKYLKSEELEGDTTLTIKSCEEEEVGQDDDKDTKPVIYFEEIDKGLALNKTNATTIAGMYGPETDDWAGKRITLFATEVDFQGKQVLAIRVRMKKPGNNQPTKPDRLETVGKAQAWNGFKLKTPSLSTQDRNTRFRAFVEECWPGKDVAKLTEDEWAHVRAQLEFVDETGEMMPI